MSIKTISATQNLVPLNSSKITELLPFSKHTLYKWHSDGKYPLLFVLIGRKVFINLAEWEKIQQKAIQKSQKAAEKVQKSLNLCN